MIKREMGQKTPKGMVAVRNFFSKCFCGQPFDADGVCNNRHFKDEEYFVPISRARERLNQNDVTEDITLCKAVGNFCSICGGHIPEGDDICDNGHILGAKYPKK